MFSGSLCALITPMLADGSIDYEAMARLLAWHIDSGTNGIVVLGTTGESATILAHERVELIKFVIAEVKQRTPVIVGTGTNCTQTTVENTRQAMQMGADAALLVTPYYNKPTQDGLYEHYVHVARQVPIPQILYNVPGRTGCDLKSEVVIKLAEFSNIVALKDASADLSRVEHMVKLQLPLDLLSGDDATAYEFMQLGGNGVVSVVSNVIPKQFQQMCQALQQGEIHTAQSINKKYQPLFSALFVESNPIPTKYLLHEMGLIQPGIRLPLTPLSPAHVPMLQEWLSVLAASTTS